MPPPGARAHSGAGGRASPGRVPRAGEARFAGKSPPMSDHFRSGSTTEVQLSPRNVRSWGQSGSRFRATGCPFVAKLGHSSVVSAAWISPSVVVSLLIEGERSWNGDWPLFLLPTWSATPALWVRMRRERFGVSPSCANKSLSPSSLSITAAASGHALLSPRPSEPTAFPRAGRGRARPSRVPGRYTRQNRSRRLPPAPGHCRTGT